MEGFKFKARPDAEDLVDIPVTHTTEYNTKKEQVFFRLEIKDLKQKLDKLADGLRYRDLWLAILGIFLTLLTNAISGWLEISESKQAIAFAETVPSLIWTILATLAFAGFCWALHKRCQTQKQTTENLIEEIKQEYHPEIGLYEWVKVSSHRQS